MQWLICIRKNPYLIGLGCYDIKWPKHWSTVKCIVINASTNSKLLMDWQLYFINYVKRIRQWRSQSKCVGRALHDRKEGKWRAKHANFPTTPSFLAVTPTFPRHSLIFHAVIFKTIYLPCTGLPRLQCLKSRTKHSGSHNTQLIEALQLILTLYRRVKNLWNFWYPGTGPPGLGVATPLEFGSNHWSTVKCIIINASTNSKLLMDWQRYFY